MIKSDKYVYRTNKECDGVLDQFSNMRVEDRIFISLFPFSFDLLELLMFLVP